MDPVIQLVELGMPWTGLDPFIFTVHHVDDYPEGNEFQGPAASLAGRRLGMDFSYRDGWSMYHGDSVPGFPQHPHRGFETVTVVRRGYVDHADSLGATARYGGGDVQWLTTGSGIMHAEMFPLIKTSEPNPLELFQIWLNLPPHSKMVDAHFSMLWSEEIPALTPRPGVRVEVVAGELDGHRPPPPPPDSWGSDPTADMAIWVILLEPGAEWVIPGAVPGVNRMLHGAQGQNIGVGDHRLAKNIGARLHPEAPVALVNDGAETAELLLLQGRPIGAPVIQMGPFVMNTADEIQTAIDDYRRTQFGGWPWESPSPVHPRTSGRFALHVDGRTEHRELQEI
ncbi:MAG: pirin family protein [Acidimicrobiia bacterium]|nr:pirin family protein [Acidimicrobiia bacterium]MDH4306038.1 pirin family protein [Acidimicrobiia bacterium]MDH5294278.1 pirin family protein [Acidimicrobiia bacterium]